MKLNNFSSSNKIINEAVIEVKNVYKIYKLYSSVAAKAIDAIGLTKLLKKNKKNYTEFQALQNVSFSINSGERVGIIGRNGAGKTTLLKLITGNFTPTQGEILINGAVQALMHVGMGFHPEFTGYENIKSSLIYNGLSGNDFNSALKDIIEFVELGDFLYQPIRTYSLGMLSRLQFAAATAIKPDILIVDEILGAGDAYFSGKSAVRMEKLANSGTTLLLVSHSIQQILQYCSRVIWIEEGRVVMDSEALAVVKKYEEFIQHLTRESKENNYILDQNNYQSTLPIWMRERILQNLFKEEYLLSDDISSVGGISRWPVEKGLKIINVKVMNQEGNQTRIVYTTFPLKIEMEFTAEEEGLFQYIAVIVLFTKDGRYLCRHCSKKYIVKLNKGEKSSIKLVYPENRLGNGDYIFSAALYKELDLKNLSTAKAYDLLSRSFEFKVQDRLGNDATLFHHPSEWITEEMTIC